MCKAWFQAVDAVMNGGLYIIRYIIDGWTEDFDIQPILPFKEPYDGTQ